MRLPRDWAVLLAGLLTATITTAQETSDEVRHFKEFFAAFADSEWTYHTHMTDAAGDTVYEGEDIRSYEFGVRDRFLIENVFGEEPDGSRTHTGIQLIGIDIKTGDINISQFWPWQSTLLGDVGARLEEQDDGSTRLVGIARPAGQKYPEFKFNCRFEDDGIYRCVTQARTADGNEYQSNVETLRRRD